MGKIWCVVTITDEFMAARTPRDLRLFRDRGKALACFDRLKEQRLAAHSHVVLMDVDHGALKLCVLRDRDEYITSISVVPVEIE